MQRLAVSIDTETLGLGENAQIIQVGAVIFDIFATGYLHGDEFLVCHESYDAVEPYAASMHPALLRALGMNADPQDVTMTPSTGQYDEANVPLSLRCRVQHIVPANMVTAFFSRWLHNNYPEYVPGDTTIVVTGKNFGSFDKHKLDKLVGWGKNFRIRHRFIDLGNLFWEPYEDGVELPSTNKCMERLGLEPEVAHTAMADAIEVSRMVQKHVRSCDVPAAS